MPVTSLTSNTILYCSKLDQTVHFYKELLALPVLFENNWFVEFELNAVSRLSIADENRASIKSCNGAGITLALEVADIEALWEQIENAGMNPTTIRAHPWDARVFYFSDPEGHRIEFWQKPHRRREGSMKATEELKKEHQGIEVMLRIIGAISDKSARGEEISVQHLVDIMEFLTVFVDKCHHGKEEEFLFPALEAAGIARESGPIGVMLHEHEEGRKLVAKLRDAVSVLKTGDQSAAADITETGNQYIALLTDHIAKENNVLFAMAEDRLDDAQDKRLFDAFEQLERDRIGVGKHEKFHVLLEELQGNYLK